MSASTEPKETLRCSFCHKSQDAVAKLISSPNHAPRAYICDECVVVCNSILVDERGDAAAVSSLTSALEIKSLVNGITRIRELANSLIARHGSPPASAI